MRGAAPYAQKKERGVPEFRHTLFISCFRHFFGFYNLAADYQ